MNAYERRQYEMLLRVRDFGNTHSSSFSQSGAAQQAFAAVDRLLGDLTDTAMLKMSASLAARANRKQAARKALTDLLLKSSQLAKLLRGEGRTIPPLELPRSRSDQALLTAGRQFARDAAALDPEFTAHGMPVNLLADATAAFEAAVRDRGMSRSDRTAAVARIRELLATAVTEARRLDLIVSNELAGDKVVEAVWKQARRIEDTRRSRTLRRDQLAREADADAAPPQAA